MRVRSTVLLVLLALGAGSLVLVLLLASRPRPEGPGSASSDTSAEPVLRSAPEILPPSSSPTLPSDRARTSAPCARVDALRLGTLSPEDRAALLIANKLSQEEIGCLSDAVRAELLDSVCDGTQGRGSRTAVSLISAVLAQESDPLRATIAGRSHRDCVLDILLASDVSGTVWAAYLSLLGMPPDANWRALDGDLAKILLAILGKHPPTDLWWKDFSMALPESPIGLFIKFNYYSVVGKEFGSQVLLPVLQRAVTWESAKTGHGTMGLVVAGEVLARFVPLEDRIALTRDSGTAAWSRTLLTSFPGELQWPASRQLSSSQAVQESLRSWLDKNWPDEEMGRLLRVHILVNEWGYMGTAASRTLAGSLRDSAPLAESSARVKAAIEGIALAEQQPDSMDAAEVASAALRGHLAGLDDRSLEEFVRAVLNWHPVRGGRDVLIRLLTTDRRIESLSRSTYDALLAK